MTRAEVYRKAAELLSDEWEEQGCLFAQFACVAIANVLLDEAGTLEGMEIESDFFATFCPAGFKGVVLFSNEIPGAGAQLPRKVQQERRIIALLLMAAAAEAGDL